MENYGLSHKDLKYVQNKIDMQKEYLEQTTFITGQGQIKSLLDISHSANHSARYYSQLVNKINTMTDYTKTIGLVPVFVTATLDGFYRDLLHNRDNTRFYFHMLVYNSLKGRKRTGKEIALYKRAKDVYKKIPDSPESDYLRTKIINNEVLNIKDLYNVLNYQMKLFLASSPFKKMRKEGFKYSYIRTVEPHKDGVPHFHMMFYIAPHFVNEVKEQFTNSFTAPRNSEPLKGCDVGQLECFQWNINKPAAYVLKYVTKSFMDLKNQKQLDYMQAWFVYYRIPRCVTSHTIIPQWVFQKVQPLESDWYYLTDIANAPNAVCEWSQEDDYFKFEDIYTGRTLSYNQGLYKIFYGDTVVKEFGQKRKDAVSIQEYSKLTDDEQKEKRIKFDKFDSVPKQWTNKKLQKDSIPLEVNGKLFYYKDGHIQEPPKQSPKLMSDFALYDYYNELDIETVNLQHYGYTKNELINRGLLNDTKQTLNLLDDDGDECFTNMQGDFCVVGSW